MDLLNKENSYVYLSEESDISYRFSKGNCEGHGHATENLKPPTCRERLELSNDTKLVSVAQMVCELDVSKVKSLFAGFSSITTRM
jgi:hypothetical protein